jgi:ketosteroid isomerase-like protein
LHRSILIASFAAAIATTAACSARTPAAVASAAEEAAVRAARAEQNRDIARRDLDSIARFWTEDVIVTSGLGRVLNGRSSYREAFHIDSNTVYERTPDEVQVSDQWQLAFETGHWTGRRRANSASTISGRYTARWVKRDGRWLIHAEVFVALTCTGWLCQLPLRQN